MRSFVLSLAATLVFAGPSFAQSTTTGKATPQVIRGSSAKHAAKKTPMAASQRRRRPRRAGGAAAAAHDPREPARPALWRLRAGPVRPAAGARHRARTLSLVNFNTQEVLTVTYWSNGAYHRDALDKLNHFLRDSRDNALTEMDPLLFDVLWHTMQIVGYGGSIEVLSAFRSPTTNAWLASVSRGGARDSQHMNGNAMDIRFPGVCSRFARPPTRSTRAASASIRAQASSTSTPVRSLLVRPCQASTSSKATSRASTSMPSSIPPGKPLGGGGVDGAIHRAAGPQLLPNAARWRLPDRQARITKGYG
jgi:uncharacterized protein YcbK (DUF882 family)